LDRVSRIARAGSLDVRRVPGEWKNCRRLYPQTDQTTADQSEAVSAVDQ
jgi:hypothetical protein